MKILVVIAIGLAACSARILVEPFNNGDYYFPGDGYNIMHLELDDTAYLSGLRINPDDNEYLLFTRINPNISQALIWENSTSILNSNFNGSKDTVIITHGWNGNEGNDNTVLLTEAFLYDNDVNVIVLDWSDIADNLYVSARYAVPDIGKRLGEFIIWMTEFGLSYERLHLVGFSLGGHVVGMAGRTIGGVAKRITALDPAGPLWYTSDDRVKSTDAQYVEVIHTSANFGYQPTCGDADFYPNGGVRQPSCWLPACSHSMAYKLMAATIKYKHLQANECESHLQVLLDNCSGDLFTMGGSDLNKNLTGIFRVDTESSYPYNATDVQ